MRRIMIIAGVLAFGLACAFALMPATSRVGAQDPTVTPRLVTPNLEKPLPWQVYLPNVFQETSPLDEVVGWLDVTDHHMVGFCDPLHPPFLDCLGYVVWITQCDGSEVIVKSSAEQIMALCYISGNWVRFRGIWESCSAYPHHLSFWETPVVVGAPCGPVTPYHSTPPTGFPTEPVGTPTDRLPTPRVLTPRSGGLTAEQIGTPFRPQPIGPEHVFLSVVQTHRFRQSGDNQSRRLIGIGDEWLYLPSVHADHCPREWNGRPSCGGAPTPPP